MAGFPIFVGILFSVLSVALLLLKCKGKAAKIREVLPSDQIKGKAAQNQRGFTK